jgi:deoxyribose-phosphate aldolase
MSPQPTYESLAGILHQILLDPALSNAQVVEALETAKRYRIGAVSVRPVDTDLAVRTLQGTTIRAGSIIGFPHGFQNTAVKLYEARDLLRRGAREIGVVIGASKLLSREFQHLQTELNQLADACREESAALTAYLEPALLTGELKIIACTCCERADVPVVGVLASSDIADLQLLRKHLPDETGVQAWGIATLDEAVEAQAAGASRIATAEVASILDAWKQQLSTAPAGSSPSA